MRVMDNSAGVWKQDKPHVARNYSTAPNVFRDSKISLEFFMNPYFFENLMCNIAQFLI